MSLAGKAALVTGASRGIGRAIALALGKAGADVAVNYHRDAEAAAAVVKELEAMGRRTSALQADVGDRRATLRLVDEAIETLGRLDVLVHNAAMSFGAKAVADITWEDWSRLMDVNLHSVFVINQAVLPQMIKQGGGSIINISSNVTGRFPPLSSAYAVSKAGMEAFTKCLSKEVGEHGIRVNAIAPGLIDTDMAARLVRENPELTRSIVETIPLRRVGRPEEIAQAAVWLADDASSYVTSQVIYVNGGSRVL